MQLAEGEKHRLFVDVEESMQCETEIHRGGSWLSAASSACGILGTYA